MLTSLHVKNRALIRDTELEFGPGLNVLSGETGAGKSILLGSILLCLGVRSDRDLIRTGAESAYVELVFRPDNDETVERLKALDLEPEDGEYVFSRRLSAVKSVSRINGETVTLSVMKTAARELIDVYTQNEQQTLLDEDNYLSILDSYGEKELAGPLSDYREAHRAYRLRKEDVKKLGSDDGERKNRLDLLSHEIRELEAVNVKPGEEDRLKEKYAVLSKAALLLEGLTATAASLSEGTDVSDAIRKLQELLKHDPTLESALALLKNAESILGDALEDVKRHLFALEGAEEELPAVEERMDEIGRFKAKYGVSADGLLPLLEKKREEFGELNRLDAEKEKLLSGLEEAKKRLLSAAEALTAVRKNIASSFETELVENLKNLNFLDVRFEAEVTESNRFSSSGSNAVTFRISTNPGEPLRPLNKTASGGELSRVMLAVKTIVSGRGKNAGKTLVFDEVDAGISGKTARLVGEKLERISKNEQVLLISHLPQIVALSDAHYRIEKSVSNGETVTSARRLNEEESVEEVARLLGTGEITKAALTNAAEMMKRKEERP